MKRKLILIGGLAAVIGGASGGIAIAAGGGGGEETPLTGSALERAVAVALDHAGGGSVIETEVGDDGAAYGVEIRLEDGTVVEVNLDESFAVIGQEADDDGPNEQDGQGED
jgi:hypothetical protein